MNDLSITQPSCFVPMAGRTGKFRHFFIKQEIFLYEFVFLAVLGACVSGKAFHFDRVFIFAYIY
jgi:hypothetical protein